MPDPVQQLTFLSWVREQVNGMVTGQSGGRSAARATVTLTARRANGSVTGTRSQEVPFLLAGPADVLGLTPQAIVRRYPAPGTLDHESDRCPYVELADPSLPWRYTPTATPAPTSAGLHPWLVLVVGTDGDELSEADGQVTIQPAAQLGAQAIGAPNTAHRFAHVQVDTAGHRVARVLSGRPLEPGMGYLAALVPAYDENGNRSWTGAAPVTVPAYDTWRFRTATPAGSFEDLAGRLRPGGAPTTIGRTPMRYPRVPADPDRVAELAVRGALVAFSTSGPGLDPPLPDVIRDDLANLRLPGTDPEGRPIVSLPRYGEAWQPAAPDHSDWGRDLNQDPRHRGVAGLGLDTGIRKQQELVDAVLEQLGDLQEARQRVCHAALGVAVSRSLWRRRVPASPTERLWLLGPALDRLTTEQGTVAELATADDRAPARGTFSAAARRMLRHGPARTTLPEQPPSPGAVLEAANREPPVPPSRIDGLPLSPTALSKFDQARQATIDEGHVTTDRLLGALTDLERGVDSRVAERASQVAAAVRQRAQSGQPTPWSEALTLLAACDSSVIRDIPRQGDVLAGLGRQLDGLRERIPEQGDDANLVDLLSDLAPATPNDPVIRPVEVGQLAAGVSAAFDPTVDRPPVVTRMLANLAGVDPDDPLVPPEVCVGLDRPAWRDLPADWLLPGIGQLPVDSVISLETNPTFVDAYLTGLNSQLLAELRWRNIPIATGCTPIRRFWDRTDRDNGARVDDIIGLHAWTDVSRLGDAGHRPGQAAGRNLVVLVRGDLFLRYPNTLIYLISARHGGTPRFDVDPDPNAARVLPGFQGRLGADVTFFAFPDLAATSVVEHWLVFEEPPAGYKFRNDTGSAATTGHEWAGAMLVSPVRVLIRGDALISANGGGA